MRKHLIPEIYTQSENSILKKGDSKLPIKRPAGELPRMESALSQWIPRNSPCYWSAMARRSGKNRS
ncbi:hypothetical protein BDV35DRAFT_352040, partial [Aspergillus flavus]